MTGHEGNFCWYELMTTDPAAARSFYGKVVGWTASDMEYSGMPGFTYTVLLANGTQVAGLMELPEGPKAAGADPFWMGYIATDDVDAMAGKVKKAGGTIHRAPDDIPGVGRFAVCADPHGATFCLFKGTGDGNGGSGAGMDPMSPGLVGWHELMAGNLDEAFAFYSGLFGWEKGEAMDMGAMGVYQIFTRNGQMLGGMMTKPAEVPRPYWGYYFIVGDIDEAVERVTASGGKIMNGPMQVPGDAWIIQATDPQGAYFALVGSRG